ncbi:MAG: hydantoinase/oxoprolinase family protein [Acetobacteraceae bacterium]|nr:hydantoinase/oxoprolinase family protein [Acetobacteraceae bacterium]
MSGTAAPAPPWLIAGVDVGGTFTDVFFLDEAAGRAGVAKVPSTRPDQSAGFLAGLRAGAPELAALATVVHGTTVGTNALLERKGARTGFITTEGFRDVLEMRRRDRPATWGLRGNFDPPVPRDLRLEVPERTLADGSIRVAIDPDAVRRAARTLLERGAQSVCIAFINSYANPANELRAAAAVRALWPNPYVVASAEILPEMREFERASTASLNAYLQPVVAHYLGRLEQALAAGRFAGEVLIVQSNGGVMDLAAARALPIRTALSGPAAGVIAAAAIASSAGHANVITGDIGGTSFDVALVSGGRAALAAEASIGFGLVIRSPMVEITTIGAGGGSIAGVDRAGLLHVGPESAGSDPGPACYGQGGARPTVTDANVLLGRIDAERPIGALAALDVAAAGRAIGEHVAGPLGIDVLDAAEAILRVANARMAGAIRLVSIERGHDPKRFALMPFGGAGALHAGALMLETGLARALVPRYPGVTSALGCVIADMRHDFVLTLNRPLDGLDEAMLAAEAARMAGRGAALLDRARVRFEGRAIELLLDMSYVGQTHTVAVPLAEGSAIGRAAIRAAFDAAYQGAFGRTLSAVPVRVLNLRVAVTGRRPRFDPMLLAPGAGLTVGAARRTARRVRAGGAWHQAEVYDRLLLPPGARILGPAVLEQPDTTIFVDPGLAASTDRLGNVLLERA